jgi:hypothetical protein
MFVLANTPPNRKAAPAGRKERPRLDSNQRPAD